MTILDHERLECVHDPPLHRDRLHCASAHILSFAVLRSDTMTFFFQPDHTGCCSVMFCASHKYKHKHKLNTAEMWCLLPFSFMT